MFSKILKLKKGKVEEILVSDEAYGYLNDTGNDKDDPCGTRKAKQE